MQDRELEFVESLIKEFKRAQTYFLVFACALLLSGISSFGWLVLHSQSDKLFYGATGGISSLFSGIPACLFFAARANAIYLGFLKVSWQDAREKDDRPVLEKLDNELLEFRKGSLSKPFWSIK
jgi:FtsH-binding integral membrane protein